MTTTLFILMTKWEIVSQRHARQYKVLLGLDQARHDKAR